MRIDNCMACQQEIEVANKSHKGRVLCPECRITRLRESGENYRRKANRETLKKCRKCGQKLNWRNVSGFCRRCGCRRGADSPLWKGGRSLLPNGYVAIKVPPDDFFAPMRGYHGDIMEHRLVMAKYLCRCLLSWEVVHHKNGVKDDNRIENLELLPGSRFHLIDQATKSYIRRLETKIKSLEAKLNEKDKNQKGICSTG